MVVFSILIERCGEDYYYRYISDNITYYIPSYKTDRLNQAVSNFETAKGYSYSDSTRSFLDKVFDEGESNIITTINDIQNKRDIEIIFTGYRYQNYIVVVGTEKTDTLLEETLFKEDYIFLIRWVSSKDEFIDNISDNVISLLGYTRHELLSKPYIEFIHVEDRVKFKEEFKNFLEQNTKSFYQKYRLVTKSGKNITVLDHTCQIIKDEKKAIVGYLRDITVEIQISSQLKELINLDEEDFNNSVLIRIEWDNDYKIIRWNTEATNIFGWGSEIIGKNIRDINLFSDADSINIQGQFKRLFAHEVTNIVSNFTIQKKDGGLVNTKWSNRLITREGKSRICSSIIDQSQEALLTNKLDEMEGRTDLLLKTLENTKMSNDVFSKLIHNPLTSNPEGLIKAEIIIRKLEEEISRLNNTIFYNNDNNLLNDVAFLKNEDHVMREKLIRIEESNKKLKDQLDDLLNVNVLSFFKELDLKGVLAFMAVCYVIFGQLLPSIYPKLIRPVINDINKEMRQIEGKN